MTDSEPRSVGGRFALAWWYPARLVFGGNFLDTVPVLVPPHVVSVTGAAHGFAMASLAIGGFAGGLLGGWVAETFAFDWLPAVTAGAVALALVRSLVAFRGVGSERTEPEPATR